MHPNPQCPSPQYTSGPLHSVQKSPTSTSCGLLAQSVLFSVCVLSQCANIDMKQLRTSGGCLNKASMITSSW